MGQSSTRCIRTTSEVHLRQPNALPFSFLRMCIRPAYPQGRLGLVREQAATIFDGAATRHGAPKQLRDP